MWAGSGKPAGQGVPSLGAGAARNRRIFILSAHVCSPATRKTSVHFIAENWARAGHEVHFTTVGYSWLSALKRSERFHHLRRNQYNRYTRQAENLNAGSYLPLVHGFSSSNPVLRPLIAPLLRAYGRHLPGFIVSTVAGSDLIVLESGTPLVFFDLLRRLNPSARMLYLCRDLLKTVGAAEAIREIERARIASFDAVCVPSRKLGTLLPPGGNVVCVPQGVERDIFDDAGSSPYPAGTRNAVIAGDMLFDRAAVASMAEAVPEVNFHLFGVPWHGPVPGNVRLYGEQPFDVLAAHIRHADFGIAPYRYGESEAYLAESSLKLLQYAYCRLPVVLPDTVPVMRGNEIRYRSAGERDWRAVVERALAMRQDTAFHIETLSWREVANMTLEAAFGSGSSTRP